MPSRRLLLAFLSVIAAAFAAPTPLLAASTDDARAVVAGLEREAVAMASATLAPAEKDRRFRTLLTTHFNVPAISRFILSRHWRSATPDQQQQFMRLFEDMTVLTWVRRFDDYGGQKLDVVKVVPEPDGFLVETAIARAAAPPMPVTWRMLDADGRLAVVDIVIEGVSMAITQRQEYGSVIQRSGGVQGLLDIMRSRVDMLQTAAQ